MFNCSKDVQLSYLNIPSFPGGSDGKASAYNAGDLGWTQLSDFTFTFLNKQECVACQISPIFDFHANFPCLKTKLK